VSLFPRESLAEQFTVVRPSGKIAPERGEQLTPRIPSTKSFADAEKL
jgi:hypothetical protein